MKRAMKAPMALIQSRVVDLSADGAGVVKAADKVYFVDRALPGELVEFEPRKKRRGRFVGILKRVIEPSPDRVEPRCEYFGVCGGCAQQHLSPDAQLVFKEKALFDNLARIAGAEPQHRMKPIRAADWHYRRKARPGIRHVPKKGGILIGFRERNSSYITSLMRCYTLDESVSALLPGLHELLEQLSCPDKIPQIEVAAADNALALVLRHLQPLNKEDIALLKRFAADKAVQFFLQPGGLDTLEPLWPESPEPLYYRLDDYDLVLRFGPTDFIQVNAAVNRAMVKQAMDLLNPGPADSVLDLFCGLGNFTLPIARSGAGVLGIEGDSGLVRRATENAALNGLSNAGFQTMELLREGVDEQLPGQKFDKVLLDPPRSGAVEVVKQLIPRIAPQVIVYVSCNPTTLARDAAILVHAQGYKMTHAGVIDMFPHTAQSESIARFER